MVYVVQVVTMLVVTTLLLVTWGLTTNPMAAGFLGLVCSLIATRCYLVWVKGAQQVYDKQDRQYRFVFRGDPGYVEKPSWAFRLGRLTARLFTR